jgi:hypothetical protein
VRNNLDPVFTTPILIDYFFEEVQYLKFEARAWRARIRIRARRSSFAARA